MNRLIKTLEEKSGNLLSVYFTAGYPDIDDTVIVMKGLRDAGADMIEVGFPFSDPMADGPVIQKSSWVALKNGMNTDILFEQLEGIKGEMDIPVILMGYFNPAFKYGMERFCRRCSESGISGLIIPDLPYEIYENEYRSIYEKYDLCYIPLITPQTSDERIIRLGEAAGSFVYLVSSSAVTGGKSDLTLNTGYFSHVRKLLPHKPLLIGFGIHDSETFAGACRNASGGIIGTAFIRSLENRPVGLTDSISAFVKSIRDIS